ncbi:MAG: PA2778 family cysteine peptidase [Burkholderiales bacterium]
MLVALYGCAGLTPRPVGLPDAAAVPGVPFFPQEQYQCGPASLATVLQYSGVSVTPEALTPQIYTPSLKGSLQFDLLGATRHAGRIPYLIEPSLSALFQEVSAGNPVLVLQNVGHFIHEWHFAVVVGYDFNTDQVILRSGGVRERHMTISKFDQSWADSDRWGFVAALPDHIPTSATEARYVPMLAALEPIHPDVAQVAYQTSLARWPNSLVALMGLGNIAYLANHDQLAAQYFLEATQAHPESGEAFNNLAQAYARQGQWLLAQTAIQKALLLGGRHVAIYGKTRDEIEAGRLAHPMAE